MIYIFSTYLIGISNCTWTSCRHGCTSEIFKCWHVLVNYTLVSGSRPIPPPWASISSLALPPPPSTLDKPTKLYPNVRGCGYPPKLQCEGNILFNPHLLNINKLLCDTFVDFFDEFGSLDSSYPCWISHMDPEIALTELDLKKLKEEVMYSLVPLATFILSTLYALCRLGVFSICNPLRCCPKLPESADQTRLTPKQLFRYKKALMAKQAGRLQIQDPSSINIPPTIIEGREGQVENSEDSDYSPTDDIVEPDVVWDEKCSEILNDSSDPFSQLETIQKKLKEELKRK